MAARRRKVAPKAPRRPLACIGSKLKVNETPRKPTKREKKIATAEYFKAYHARKAAEKAESANEPITPNRATTPKKAVPAKAVTEAPATKKATAKKAPAKKAANKKV